MQQSFPQDDVDQQQQQFPSEPPRQGLSSGAKIGIGCTIFVLLVIILLCAGAWFWWQNLLGQADEFVSDFEQQGYTVVEGNGELRITETVTEPTVFVATMNVVIDADVEADIAISAVNAEIHGRVEGNVDFLGFSLLIGPNAVITGDVRPQRGMTAVDVRGTVEGTVTEGQVIEQPEPPAVPEPNGD